VGSVYFSTGAWRYLETSMTGSTFCLCPSEERTTIKNETTMKKALALLGLLLVFTLTYGKKVDINTAQMVGRTYLANNTDSPTLKSATNLQLVYESNSKPANNLKSGQPLTYFYVFNVNSSGFIIVAGDDNVTPILGYSDNGVFDTSNLPKNFAEWLEGYNGQIQYIIENNIQACSQISEKWENLKNGNFSNPSSDATSNVGPLLQGIKWDQNLPYKAKCPPFNFLGIGNDPTGCTATAMAQIMKYYSYPSSGISEHKYVLPDYGELYANFGLTTYHWDLMGETNYLPNDALATFMFQVGVSVGMKYSPKGSGAQILASIGGEHSAEYALRTYFGYKSSLRGVSKTDYSPSQWVQLLKDELNNNRPILYVALADGGAHAFVCDGYNSNGTFNFNWGWGGGCNGAYQLSAMDPTCDAVGNYYDRHQAVIGIEPPAASQTYKLELCDNVTPSTSTIYYGNAFNVTTNIANKGTNSFTGDYTAAIFDESYNFVCYIETKTNYGALPGGKQYVDKIKFSTDGLFSMVPGKYYIGIFYRPLDGNWIQVPNGLWYPNLVQITVINPNTIALNSAINVSPGTTLTQGQAATVTVNFRNDGTTTFIGQYLVGLYNLAGSWAQTINTFNENSGLIAHGTYQSPKSFSSLITVSPGTYLLVVFHNPNGTGWQTTGSSTNYPNPIKVIVAAPILQPDIYEPNNSASQSYNLPVSFSGNTIAKNTTGSNFHNTTDIDYYKVILPTGYNYSITPRLHDSNNSGNGLVYSVDAVFSYSTNNTTWSDSFDNVMSGNINLVGGGIVYFKVAPYFAGETGTYLLEVSITRSSGLSNVATLSDLRVSGITVANFSSSTLNYSVALPHNTTSVPPVTATTTDSKATKVITQAAALPGTSTVVVTAEDGTTKKTYSVYFTLSNPDVFNPPRNLTAGVIESSVTLNWISPIAGSSGILSGFKVYRNGSVITTLTNPTLLNYTNSGLAAGTYTYYVTATYTSINGESSASNQVSVTISTTGLPDLVINNPKVTPADIFVGDVIEASGQVANSGTANAGTSIFKVFLSANTTYEASDFLLASGRTDPINVGSNWPFTLSGIFIPGSTKAGNFYVLFLADANGVIAELNENNNTAIVPITVKSGSAIENDVILSNIKLFPVPAFDHLAIRYSGTYSGMCKITFFNIIGSNVFSEQIYIQDGLMHSIDVRSWLNGYYFVQFKTDKETFIQQIMVTH